MLPTKERVVYGNVDARISAAFVANLSPRRTRVGLFAATLLGVFVAVHAAQDPQADDYKNPMRRITISRKDKAPKYKHGFIEKWKPGELGKFQKKWSEHCPINLKDETFRWRKVWLKRHPKDKKTGFGTEAHALRDLQKVYPCKVCMKPFRKADDDLAPFWKGDDLLDHVVFDQTAFLDRALGSSSLGCDKCYKGWTPPLCEEPATPVGPEANVSDASPDKLLLPDDSAATKLLFLDRRLASAVSTSGTSHSILMCMCAGFGLFMAYFRHHAAEQFGRL